MINNNKPATQFFNAATNDRELVLSIYDAIGGDVFDSGITAAQVQDALKGDYDSVTVRINSPGGDAFEGVTIHSLLKANGKPVNVIVDGLAASAASVVAMAGDTITMNDGSMMMIHPAMGMSVGDADTMRKMADTLDKVTDSIADIYVNRTGQSKAKVLKMMADETWMGAADAKELGFANKIGTGQRVTNSFDLSCFKNTPISLKIQTKEVDGEELVAEDFIYAGNPHDASTWALPWHFSTEEKTKSHLRDALARWNQEEKIPESHKAEAHAKLLRLCKEHSIEVSEPSNTSTDFNPVGLLRKQLEVNKRK